MLSAMLLTAWRGDLTTFNGFFDTRPSLEIDAATWGHIVHVIAPAEGPPAVLEKERSTYFVGSRLKSAPLVNGTLTKAKKLGLPTIGKQRSASHVTEAHMVIADLDGIAEGQVAVIEKRLIDAGVTYLVYSSHSFGRQDKPGVRCRLVVPVDMALDCAAYKRAAQGLNTLLLDGRADQSGFALHQQQGTWATAPERVELAFRRMSRAGVCSAAALQAAGPKTEGPKPGGLHVVATEPGEFDAAHVAGALALLDANDYSDWFNALAWLKAAYGASAYPVWLAWSQTASEQHRANKDECAAEWAKLVTRIPAGAGAGKLFGFARDAAVSAVKQAGQSGQWGQREKSALILLKRFHPKTYAQLIA